MNITKRLALLLPALAITSLCFAREGYDNPPKPASIGDPMVTMLVIIMAILLLIIILLANVLTGAAAYYYQKEKEKETEKKKTTIAPAALIVLLLFAAMPVFAQHTTTKAVVETSKGFGTLSSTAFSMITGVIVVELLVIVVLLWQLRSFLRKVKDQNIPESEDAPAKPAAWKAIWSKLNSFKPAEQEKELELEHEYDGIRELNNRLPPWWLYGFYCSVIFAIIYLWRYHVSESAPLSQQEFAIAMEKAEAQKAAYLKKSANNVDENTVKLLTDAGAIDAGRTVFVQNCAACHGKDGEGTVGPNLTDDYWLHGGSIQDIFKSVKYGWPEKGMRSWKDDLSPMQIAQVSSFIKSIHGSNPPNAKEKQGELYQETSAPDSTTAANPDSTGLSLK